MNNQEYMATPIFIIIIVVSAIVGTTAFSPHEVYANADTDVNVDSAAYVDSVRFVQYLDENTALEEVRAGNLDAYYFRISSDRLETHQARQGLDVFDSTGGSYSILVNPAVSEKAFNPFQDREIRFALNYLVDRRLIVNELMGGYGIPIISHYGPTDPEYLTVIERLASINFEYNPALAESTITERLTMMGATKDDRGMWITNGEPIELVLFIRSDDPVRKSIGEILASELERIGFVVTKDFGDLNKAFVVVYGSNPADLGWHLYTEGWAQSAFVRYDSTGLGQMYSPWFSNMPGFNDPSYWNYENARLDNLTKRIYTGDFENVKERALLIEDAIAEGVSESVRIFLASRTDQYVVNESVSGIINDFGAGVPSRFTPINARIGTEGGEMTIGVKQIYQGAWNPVAGFRDAYSRQIGTLLLDPSTFKHPFTGETIPIRATWNVETAGPGDSLEVADDTIFWNSKDQRWDRVAAGVNATSKVTFEYSLGNWHNGEPMDILDILYSVYFAGEWGTQTGEDDITFDTEFTSMVAPRVESIVGVRPTGHSTLEVYANYWHFDDGEIAQWAAPGVTMPWEMITAMEGAVTDGKVSFSRSGAANKGVNWLSLIVPNDAELLREYLTSMRDSGHVPPALAAEPVGKILTSADPKYVESRYDSSIRWISETGHAMIGNGPFYLDAYWPESRSIRIIAFEDKSYPFERDAWSDFESAELPLVTGISMTDTGRQGEAMKIGIDTTDADSVMYFVANGMGEIVSSGMQTIPKDDVDGGNTDGASASSAGADGDTGGGNTQTEIMISADDTSLLTQGANTVRIFAISDTVLRPDYYETGFFVMPAGSADNYTHDPDDSTEKGALQYKDESDTTDLVPLQAEGQIEMSYLLVLIPIVVILFLIFTYKKRKKMQTPAQ